MSGAPSPGSWSGPQSPALWPCPRCSTPILADSTFCPRCGFQLSQPITGASPQPIAKPNNSRRTLLAVIVVGVILLALGGYFSKSPPAGPGSPGVQPPGQTQRAVAVTPAPRAAFADIILSGSGDSVKPFSIPEDLAALATLTHSGSENFIVHSLAASGSENDLLVNTIGRYSGTVLFDAGSGEHSTALQIEADGSWTVTIKHPTKARAWAPTSAVSGNGDDVLRLAPQPSGLTPIKITHMGDSNIIVHAYSPTGTDLLVNEIGAYNGTVPLPSGTYLVTVESEGAWTIGP